VVARVSTVSSQLCLAMNPTVVKEFERSLGERY
jgi:hypothetical protein